MKNINSYILEKFKINKSTINSGHSLEEGKTVVKVIFRVSEEKKFVQIDISVPRKIVKIEEDKIVYTYFKNPKDSSAWDINNKKNKNSKGYLQDNFKNEEDIVSIFLNENDSIDYLEDCLNNIETPDKTFITRLVDYKDKEKLEGKKIVICTTKNTIERYLKEYLAF